MGSSNHTRNIDKKKMNELGSMNTVRIPGDSQADRGKPAEARDSYNERENRPTEELSKHINERTKNSF